jgi:hypothetical protein
MSSKQSSSKTKKSFNKMLLTSRVNNGMSSADIQQLGNHLSVQDAKAIYNAAKNAHQAKKDKEKKQDRTRQKGLVRKACAIQGGGKKKKKSLTAKKRSISRANCTQISKQGKIH